jgi:predicted permease
MPDWTEEIRSRLAGLDLEPTRESEIVEELAQHAADRYQELLAKGISQDDACRRTIAELSDSRLPANLLQGKAGDGPKPLFSRHFAFSARILATYWKLTVVAVVSLAVAIAAVVTGISIINALLLRPPGVREPGRLLTLYESTPADSMQQVSLPDYQFFRDNSHMLSGLAAFNYGFNMLTFNDGKRSERINVTTVSENYFDVLEVQPAAGRLFHGDDSQPKAEIVLSYPFWLRLGADPAICGETIHLNGHQATIAGVAAKGFTGTVAGFSIDAWAPLRIDQALARGTTQMEQAKAAVESRSGHWLTAVGRLKSGAEQPQAQAELATLAERLALDFPDTNKDRVAGTAVTTLLPTGEQGLVKVLSWTVAAIIFLVLVAACANVVNLLLGLATARRQEILIRAALGATRARLVRLLLQESVWICLIGGVLGLGMAYAGLERLFAFRPVIINGFPPLLLDCRPDLKVVGLAVAVIMLATLAVGLAPALYSSIPNLAGALNGEMAVGGTSKRRARAVLVAIQTAVCTVILVGAGLCLRSLEQLKRVPLGFSGRNLVEVGAQASDAADQQKLNAVLRAEITAFPGVTEVTLASSLPLGGQGYDRNRIVGEGEENKADRWAEAGYSLVEGNYFSMLGIPLLAGRTFASTDREHTPEVVIINQTLARKYWPGEEPIGKRLRIADGKRLVEVVGLVGDSKYTDLDEPQLPFMFLAASQHPRQAGDLALIAATNDNARLWREPLRALVRKHDPAALSYIMTLDDQIDLSLLVPRTIFACAGGFGLLALVLSMTGLYATTAYSVSERKKEIGIRVALGAQPRDLLLSLLRHSALVTAVGLATGLVLGVAMSWLLGSALYGIRPVEATVLIAVALLTAFLALTTAYFAARPWVNADPLEAVRHA